MLEAFVAALVGTLSSVWSGLVGLVRGRLGTEPEQAALDGLAQAPGSRLDNDRPAVAPDVGDRRAG